MSPADNKRIAKNTAMLYFRMVVAMIVSLYTSRIVLSALGFVDFGIYNVVGGIVAVFSVLTSSLSGTSARYITLELGKKDHTRLGNTFSTSAILHFALAGGIILISEVFGVWFLNYELDIPPDRLYAANWLLQFSILTAAFALTQVPYNAAMIAHENMSVFAYVGLFTSFGSLAVALLIEREPFDRLIWYGFLMLLLNLASLAISRYYCIRRYSECRLRRPSERRLFKEMLSYTGYSLWVNVAWMTQNQGISFILNIFFGPILNAAQAVATKIFSLLEQLYSGFGTAIKPSIYRMYAQEEYADMNRLVERGAVISYFLVLLFVMPIAFNADVVLTIWLGHFPDYTIPISICLMVVELFAVIGNTRLMLFQASNHIKEYSIYNGSILITGLPMAYVAFKIGFSPVSAFAILIFTAAASDMMSVFLLKKFISGYSAGRFLTVVHLPCIVFTAALCMIMTAEKSLVGNQYASLATTTATSTALILIFLWYAVITKEQRKALILKLHNILHR